MVLTSLGWFGWFLGDCFFFLEGGGGSKWGLLNNTIH